MKMTREDIDVTSYFVSVTGWVTGESVITGYLIPNRGPFFLRRVPQNFYYASYTMVIENLIEHSSIY